MPPGPGVVARERLAGPLNSQPQADGGETQGGDHGQDGEWEGRHRRPETGEVAEESRLSHRASF